MRIVKKEIEMATNVQRPWTGKDVSWEHHTIILDGEAVRISREITMPLDTFAHERDGYVG